MSTTAVLLDVALIVAFAAGILYWVFITPKREKERWRGQLDVGSIGEPRPDSRAEQAWEGESGSTHRGP